MYRLRLSTLLVAINVGLLLLVAAAGAVAAGPLLRRFTDEQALARVEQAGLSAQRAIEQAGLSALASAHVLAEHPALLQQLQAGDQAALSQFLRSRRLAGCALLHGRQLLGASGPALDWAALAGQAGEQGLYQPRSAQPLVLGARAAVPGRPTTYVLVAIVLDQSFAERLGRELGVAVAIERGAASVAVVARRDELASYQARRPLTDRAGTPIGTIVASLPTSFLAQPLAQLLRMLVLMIASAALLAGLASLLIGRRLSRPLKTLTGAVARIGRGDLATPVGVAPGGEIGALAATLEAMRWQLWRLTADMRRQQAESQAIITGIVEGVFSVDRERNIRYVNPQAAALLGLAPGDMVGRFCGDVLNPQAANGRRPCAEQCPIIHARFRDGANATEQLLLRDGRRRTVVITSAPPADDQQVQVLRDETEREAVRRLRDAVLDNISHEFRTPLSAQLASIELLLDQLPTLTTDQIGQLILSLQRGTLRLTQLIDNLLASARIESGRFAIRHQLLALDEVVEDALELTRPLLTQRSQQVNVGLPFPLPPISGDAPLLTQVLVNLLANANKFAPVGSVITVGGAVGPATVTLWVADQGPGLPPAGATALFGQFIRSAGDEPEQSGVGLGLWIVQSIIERHGGQVSAQSTSAGTCVSITLPLATKQ